MCRAGGGEHLCSNPARHERPRHTAPDVFYFIELSCRRVRAGAALCCEHSGRRARLSLLTLPNLAIGSKTDRALGPGASIAIWLGEVASSPGNADSPTTNAGKSTGEWRQAVSKKARKQGRI